MVDNGPVFVIVFSCSQDCTDNSLDVVYCEKAADKIAPR
jgi:hypothetical protein